MVVLLQTKITGTWKAISYRRVSNTQYFYCFSALHAVMDKSLLSTPRNIALLSLFPSQRIAVLRTRLGNCKAAVL